MVRFEWLSGCWRSVSKWGKEKVYAAGLAAVYSKIDDWEKFWFILTSNFFILFLFYFIICDRTKTLHTSLRLYASDIPSVLLLCFLELVATLVWVEPEAAHSKGQVWSWRTALPPLWMLSWGSHNLLALARGPWCGVWTRHSYFNTLCDSFPF